MYSEPINSQFFFNETFLTQWIWIVPNGHWSYPSIGHLRFKYGKSYLKQAKKPEKNVFFVGFRPYSGQSDNHVIKVEPHQCPLDQSILSTYQMCMLCIKLIAGLI